MKIDGKIIAEKIYADLKKQVGELQKKNITPKLAVILIGDDPGSVSYVNQKEKHARNIGIALQIDRLPISVSEDRLKNLLTTYNNTPEIHGIIIQRPSPKQITKDFLDQAVIPEKDVDGFHPNSDFAAPVALAVERLLYEVFKVNKGKEVTFDSFIEWLLTQDMVVLGKGETAGSPIISHFHNRNARITVIDSQTEDPQSIIGGADIVISAVGKKDILTAAMVAEDAIVIGVGLHTEDGKLRGDFNDIEIAKRVACYSPTPGGVGPVNVAMLLANVIRAAEEQAGE